MQEGAGGGCDCGGGGGGGGGGEEMTGCVTTTGDAVDCEGSEGGSTGAASAGATGEVRSGDIVRVVGEETDLSDRFRRELVEN